jgi:hypothetical protein
MTQVAPVPTPGQKLASHIIVALLAGAVVHVVASELTDLTPEERWALTIISALAVAYAHHHYDAPVAKYIALKAV